MGPTNANKCESVDGAHKTVKKKKKKRGTGPSQIQNASKLEFAEHKGPYNELVAIEHKEKRKVWGSLNTFTSNT